QHASIILALILIYSFLIIMRFKSNEYLQILFFFLPMPNLFDQIGFFYIFNVLIGFIFLKELLVYLFYGRRISIVFLLITFLMIYNIILGFSNGVDLFVIISHISNFLSIFLFYFISKKQINIRNVYIYLLTGYFLSLVLGIY